jgi:hypothetical protein
MMSDLFAVVAWFDSSKASCNGVSGSIADGAVSQKRGGVNFSYAIGTRRRDVESVNVDGVRLSPHPFVVCCYLLIRE